MKIKFEYDTATKEYTTEGVDFSAGNLRSFCFYPADKYSEARLVMDFEEISEDEGFRKYSYVVASKGELVKQEEKVEDVIVRCLSAIMRK